MKSVITSVREFSPFSTIFGRLLGLPDVRYVHFLEEKTRRLESQLEVVSQKICIDPLTEVYNRRKFDDDIDKYVARVDRTQKDLSLLMIDIDDFKSVNDTYGHLKGDDVLYSTANSLKNILRTYERNQVYRYGGEEFAILLPDTTLSEGIAVADRVCKEVNNSVLIDSFCKKYVSVSVGVANYREGCVNGFELIDFADKALYQAKSSGKNKFCVYSH